MTEKAIKEELRKYSERCYAQPLEAVGFVSYRDDLLNWYKVYNGMISHFHILVSHSRLPMMMLVWWFHPTYVPAELKLPVSWPNYCADNEMHVNKLYFHSYTVEPGCGVNIPNLPRLGAERLDENFFPQMEQLQTREAFYKYQRENILARAKKPNVSLFNLTTPDFADQALMMQDTEMFEPCIKCIEIILGRLKNSYKPNDYFSSEAEFLKAQLKALQGEDVERYFELLKERKAGFLKKYKLRDDAFEL